MHTVLSLDFKYLEEIKIYDKICLETLLPVDSRVKREISLESFLVIFSFGTFQKHGWKQVFDSFELKRMFLYVKCLECRIFQNK